MLSNSKDLGVGQAGVVVDGGVDVVVADLGLLDQPQEVRAGWEHRAADVLLREAVQLPQQCVAGSLQIPVEIRLR
jgi:hypothetical protein